MRLSIVIGRAGKWKAVRLSCMATATVSSKGQVSIPKAVRDRLHLKPGTELTIEVQGESLVMKRAAPELPHWETMRGMAKGGESLTKALEEDRAAENAHYDARIRQGR
jgi:antitoxin PrlF